MKSARTFLQLTALSLFISACSMSGSLKSNRPTSEVELQAPPSLTVTSGSDSKLTVEPAGGTGPYSYKIVSGLGSINSTTGEFIPSGTAGITIVRTTDSLGATKETSINNIRIQANGSVNTLEVYGDSLFMGGTFTAVNPQQSPRFIALSETGQPFWNCDLQNGFENQVRAIIRVKNSIYIGGSFTKYQDKTVNYIAKIDLPYCTLDTQFSYSNGSAGAGFDAAVYALAYSEKQDAIYVGGAFSNYKTIANSAKNIAKLNPYTGEIDTTFSPPGASSNGFNNTVYALAVNDSNNSIYVGGAFNVYRGVPYNANNLVKIDLASGAADSTFSPIGMTANGFDSQVSALAISTDNNALYVGGNFTSYKGVANSANRLAKLNLSSGAIDTTFSPVGATANGFGGNVNAVHVSGGSLYVGGAFTAYKGIANSANYIAKLDKNSGAIDTTFSPVGATANGFGGNVNSISSLNNFLYAGGAFTAYKGVANSANYIAKINTVTGELDTSFRPVGNTYSGFDALVNTVTIDSSGYIFIGGSMKVFGGYSANRFAKIDLLTNKLDTQFSPPSANGFEATVATTVISPSLNAIFVGGWFKSYKGITNSANCLAKLDLTTGEIDTNFSPVGATANGFGSTCTGVFKLALSNSGHIYARGTYTRYRAQTTGVSGLAKITASTGVLDTTFNNPAGPGFFDSSSQTDTLAISDLTSSVYLGGSFSTYAGASANRIAKVSMTNRALDATFSPPANNGFGTGCCMNPVTALQVVEASNSLYVGGMFTTYRGVANSAKSFAKLNLTNGDIDTSFSSLAENGYTVTSSDAITGFLFSSAENLLYTIGWFTSYRGIANGALYLSRIDATSGWQDMTFSPAGVGNNGFDSGTRSIAKYGNIIFIGGAFSKYKDKNSFFLAAIDATTGELK